MHIFFFQAEDGIRDADVTGVQTCALPIYDLRGGDLELPGSDGTLGQLQIAAAQVVASQPDVIVVGGTVSAIAMSKATTALPVVFLAVGVPVEIGLVASLSRPGGNMNGVTFAPATDTYGKRR